MDTGSMNPGGCPYIKFNLNTLAGIQGDLARAENKVLLVTQKVPPTHTISLPCCMCTCFEPPEQLFLGVAAGRRRQEWNSTCDSQDPSLHL